MNSRAFLRNLAGFGCLLVGQLAPFAAQASVNASTTASSCTAPRFADAPLCPTNTSLLTDKYPVQALTISDQGGAKLVIDTVEKVFKAQSNQPPLIFLNVQSETLQTLKTHLSQQPWATKQMLANLRQVTSTIKDDMDDENEFRLEWQQDIALGVFNPATGQAMTKFVSEYPATGTLTDELSKNMRTCGIETAPPTPNTNPKNGFSGGNLTLITPDVCVLGDSDLTPKEWQSYSQAMCGPKLTVVKAPSFWTESSHVDEIFKAVQVPGDACNLVLEIASPRKAMELLATHPQDRFTDLDTDSITGLQITGGPREQRGLNTLFSSWQQTAREPKAAAKYGYKADEKDADTDEPIIMPFGSQIIRYFDPKLDTSKLTNAQIATFIQHDVQTHEYNQLVQTQLDAFEIALLKTLQAKSPQCKLSVLEVPQLFVGNIVVRNGHHLQKGATSGTGFSILPNPTNSVQVGKTILMPEPHSGTFKTYLVQNLTNAGLHVETVDTLEHHASGGDLHCATQTFRACRAH